MRFSAAMSLALALTLLVSPEAQAADIPMCSPGPGQLKSVVEKHEGRKLKEGQLRGGVRDGRWIFYWPNGHKKEQSFYCNGVLHGESTFWYESGLPELEGAFNAGHPAGPWTHWGPNAKRKRFTPAKHADPISFFEKEGARALAVGELSRSESLLKLGLRRAPQNPNLHRYLGVISARQGEAAKAAFHYRRYVQLAPHAPDRPQVERILAAYENSRHRGTAPGVAPVDAGVTSPGQPPKPIRVQVELLTTPSAVVYVDGARLPTPTNPDGTLALDLEPGTHTVMLEVGTVRQRLLVTVSEEDGDNRLEFMPGQRLVTSGNVQVQPADAP